MRIVWSGRFVGGILWLGHVFKDGCCGISMWQCLAGWIVFGVRVVWLK